MKWSKINEMYVQQKVRYSDPEPDIFGMKMLPESRRSVTPFDAENGGKSDAEAAHEKWLPRSPKPEQVSAKSVTQFIKCCVAPLPTPTLPNSLLDSDESRRLSGKDIK